MMSFNPRARVGRDAFSFAFFISSIAFQSTRPRGARQEWQEYERAVLDVSIHAPAWGATFSVPDYKLLPGVSIHAPAWGATLHFLHKRGAHRRFNPRARVGRDTKEVFMAILSIAFQSTRPRGARLASNHDGCIEAGVSIHAPAWGATAKLLGQVNFFA